MSWDLILVIGDLEIAADSACLACNEESVVVFMTISEVGSLLQLDTFYVMTILFGPLDMLFEGFI